MKFGGTSVGTAERFLNVAKLIQGKISQKLVVVVSAVGGITNLLLQAGEESLRLEPSISKQEEFPASLKRIYEIHDEILKFLQLDPEFFQKFYVELSEIYKGISLLKEFSPRARDLVSSYGERISARILAACLQKLKINAQAVDAWDAGFITTNDFTNARLLPDSPHKLNEAIGKMNFLPVITGFIGKSREGHITTIGRGGSDFSASLIGAAVQAGIIEIWTDVSGIMTSDPRLAPQAKPLDSLSFQEAAELSYFGAKILHPKTIEPAMRKKIPVLVKNSFKPEEPGTLILPESEKEPGLKAVTLKRGIVRVNLYSSGMLEAPGFLSRVFKIFEKHEISVDVIATSEVNVSLTLDHADGLEKAVSELSEFADVEVERDRAIICLVGEGLKQTPGIAGRVFKILGDACINIEMISQGASQINLTFVVRSSDSDKAVKLLHREFFE